MFVNVFRIKLLEISLFLNISKFSILLDVFIVDLCISGKIQVIIWMFLMTKIEFLIVPKGEDSPTKSSLILKSQRD